MLYIGCHLSASKGFLAMGKQAVAIGANTFQFFTRNPRGGAAKAIDEKDIEAYLQFAKENGIGKIVAHAPYTLNCSGKDEKVRSFAFETFKDDLHRMEFVPGNYYNFHPGSHVGQGEEVGIELVADVLNKTLFPEMTTTVLLETMAGKGTELGRNFEQLQKIIEKVELKDKVGICLDTCHVFDGGYDIVNDLNNVMKTFDDIIGLDKLKAIHLNDSKNVFNSHKDRHEKLGEGNIGFDALMNVITHPAVQGLPVNLETPNEIEGYEKEIAQIKNALRS